MLKYPHVRLALLNHLSAHGDCVKAFAEAARGCGLHFPEDLTAIQSEVRAGACGALTSARACLSETVPAHAEVIWAELSAAIEQYKGQVAKKHVQGLTESSEVLGCGGLASVVIDILLQKITPYLSG